MNTYCTYLTIYQGNKLPPFYIGHTTLDNIKKGYGGSIKSKNYKPIWQSERKNNPHLFMTQILTTHNNRQDAMEREQSFQRSMNVIHNPLYINKAIGRYCTTTGFLGFHHTDQAKQRQSVALKNRPKSEEHKRKIGLGNKGKKRPDLTERNRRRFIGWADPISG